MFWNDARKGRNMSDFWADVMKDPILLLLAGIGVTFAPHDWLGGMFLALAAAAFSMHVEPERDRVELWVVLMGAFIVSHISALVAHKFFPGIQIQLVMIVSGLLSRRAARLVLRAAGRLEDRGDALTDRIVDHVLPPSPPKKEGDK